MQIHHLATLVEILAEAVRKEILPEQSFEQN
jgi:hypothetical protein